MAITNPRMNVQRLTFDDRYHIEEFIGGGQLTEVWRATDEHLDIDVAVKLAIPPSDDDAHPEWVEYKRRFQRAARAAATVRGGHIVPVLDCSTWDDTPYLVMEYVPGTRLDTEKKERGTFSVEDATCVLHDLLDGLASLHRVKLMHRDVKPANILHDEDGRYRLTGFELAKSLTPTDDEWSTTIGERVGSDEDYMSPEMISAGMSGPRGDLYAAGIIAWELVTGRNPVAGPADEPAWQRGPRRLELKVPKLATAAEGVPAELSAFIARLTALDPAERPADAMEALAAFPQI